MDQNFWRGKRVLLTGHTGFKGSWLSLWLAEMGAHVVGFSLEPPTKPSLYEVANVAQVLTSVLGDIRDLAKLRDTFERYQPEIVIHMAAQSLVRYSYHHPVETYTTNVIGTVHLLEAVRHVSSVRAVLNVTSDKCYENREWLWGYRENERMGGFDPYSNSKGCAELVTSAYRDSFFPPGSFDKHQVAIASVRAGNVIGGGDWAGDRLIPDVIRAFSDGQPVVIRNPHAIRPWQHVLEPLSGYLLLAQRLYEQGAEFSGGWNFGPAEEDAKPVEWIVDRLTRSWGEGATWRNEQSLSLHEAHYLKLDCSKARVQLGWRPRWTLNVALESIVDWYKAYLHNEDMRNFSMKQLGSYLSS